VAKAGTQRLAYVDWMRGLACVLMFQTHCYDSWLGGEARNTKFFMWSQLGGTLPAPLFLFLAGISFALVTDKMRQRSTSPNKVARTTIRRGAEIFGIGLLFRLQEYLLGIPGAPWTDLLRVDILNTIGLSMMLMGVLCRVVAPAEAAENVRARATNALAAVAVALAISLLTPPLWTTWRPSWMPWPFQSYINGIHIYKEPQAWLFPIFPWTGFAFAGLAVGFALLTDAAKKAGGWVFAALGTGGLIVAEGAHWLDNLPQQFYAVYDFWHTSPNFFLIRVGLLLMILFGAYAWCRWGAGQWGFSPLIQLGQTSLLVYWVHIEFVYGRFSILPKRAMGIPGASLGLLIIFLSMLLLSLARTRLKGHGAEALSWVARFSRNFTRERRVAQSPPVA
jgi:uncharacterized membrane protein